MGKMSHLIPVVPPSSTCIVFRTYLMHARRVARIWVGRDHYKSISEATSSAGSTDHPTHQRCAIIDTPKTV
nr:hypothetical protein CFP56_13002 [Quercus suber]